MKEQPEPLIEEKYSTNSLMNPYVFRKMLDDPKLKAE